MLSENDKKLLKKYKHLIACLIDNSIGYFTPLAALRAIQAHKNREPYYCELYMDIYYKQKKYKDPSEYPETETEHYKKINKDYIKNSLQYFKLPTHTYCLAIVEKNINGMQSIGASWF